MIKHKVEANRKEIIQIKTQTLDTKIKNFSRETQIFQPQNGK